MLFGGGFTSGFFLGVDSHDEHIRSFFSLFSFLSCPQFCALFVCTSCPQIEAPNNKSVVMSFKVYGVQVSGVQGVQQGLQYK